MSGIIVCLTGPLVSEETSGNLLRGTMDSADKTVGSCCSKVLDRSGTSVVSQVRSSDDGRSAHISYSSTDMIYCLLADSASYLACATAISASCFSCISAISAAMVFASLNGSAASSFPIDSSSADLLPVVPNGILARKDVTGDNGRFEIELESMNNDGGDGCGCLVRCRIKIALVIRFLIGIRWIWMDVLLNLHSKLEHKAKRG